MSNNFEVGEKYKAKSYLECGYNFPEGKYKIKAKIDGFPEKPINHEDELTHANEQWLEGYEDDPDYYKQLYNGLWYYLEFPDRARFEWIPEVVMKDVFKKIE